MRENIPRPDLYFFGASQELKRRDPSGKQPPQWRDTTIRSWPSRHLLAQPRKLDAHGCGCTLLRVPLRGFSSTPGIKGVLLLGEIPVRYHAKTRQRRAHVAVGRCGWPIFARISTTCEVVLQPVSTGRQNSSENPSERFRRDHLCASTSSPTAGHLCKLGMYNKLREQLFGQQICKLVLFEAPLTRAGTIHVTRPSRDPRT